MKKTIRTMQPTKDQSKQLTALDAIRDEDIDLSDIPEQGGRTEWVRGLMYRPVMQAISIRLPAPDLALARQLAQRKGLPYQTYIKRLLHDALDRERVSGR
jgi:predicted DNA binding CopG/RHH family protein